MLGPPALDDLPDDKFQRHASMDCIGPFGISSAIFGRALSPFGKESSRFQVWTSRGQRGSVAPWRAAARFSMLSPANASNSHLGESGVSDSANSDLIPLTSFSRKQRRVLGVLLEKAFTVPEQYPLTLKGTTTGCNQKNNRDPISQYDEDDVAETLNELQTLGFVGCIHTESGRTERYRHYLRLRTTLTGPQLAIMTELLLRGRQQLGELRTRASRMAQIESQDDLRRELQSLLEANLVRSDGPLERRGIEVDHNLYPEGENHEQLSALSDDDRGHADDRTGSVVTRPAPGAGSVAMVSSAASRASDERVSTLEANVRELKDDLGSIRDEFLSLQDRFEDLRRQLGG
jgi:uncharacterized protein